jgi:hypothetical protein
MQIRAADQAARAHRGCPAGGEHRCECPRQSDRSEEVGFHDFTDLLVRECQERVRFDAYAGVVDQNADVLGPGNGGPDRVRAGDIEGEGDYPGVIPLLRAAGRRIHLRSTSGEGLFHELAAQASICTGNEDDGAR